MYRSSNPALGIRSTQHPEGTFVAFSRLGMIAPSPNGLPTPATSLRPTSPKSINPVNFPRVASIRRAVLDYTDEVCFGIGPPMARRRPWAAKSV